MDRIFLQGQGSPTRRVAANFRPIPMTRCSASAVISPDAPRQLPNHQALRVENYRTQSRKDLNGRAHSKEPIVNSRMGYALGIALALALACGNAMAQEIRWAPDIATARRAALEYKVPLLIHFYGDNCLPCKLLEQNVLTRQEVVETLNKYFICVRINGSQDRQLAAEYGVHSWPTDVFLGPDGKPLDQGVCKQSPGEYLSVLHNMAVLNRDRNVLLASQQAESAKQVTSQVANYAQQAQPVVNNAQQAMNNLQTQANSVAGALPAAGIAPAGNPNGPNFYAQSAHAGFQQLPNSLMPNAAVTGGPMLSQNQPQAITTAVSAAGSQIARAALPHLII